MIPAKIKQARSKTALRRIPPITMELVDKIFDRLMKDMFGKDWK